MKHILSCTNRNDSLISVSKITGIYPTAIESFIESLPKNLSCDNPSDLLWCKFKDSFSLHPSPFVTSYFHGCRRFYKPSLSQDILPNHLIIDDIWGNIWSNCSDLPPMASLQLFKISFLSSAWRREYSNRVKGPRIRERGPWAFIIKDCLAYRATNHYTQSLPEIMKIISNFVSEEFNIDITARLTENTKPYIIQFITEDSELSNLGYALPYLHERYKETPFPYSTYKCYSAEGKIIRSND